MTVSLFSSAAGWSAVVLLTLAVIAPYLLRSTCFARALDAIGNVRGTFLERMQAHAWLGYAVGLLGVIHLFAAYQSGALVHVNPVGVWIAVPAPALLGIQIWLGTQLIRPLCLKRPEMRRWHFRVMLALLLLVALHTYLASPLFADIVIV